MNKIFHRWLWTWDCRDNVQSLSGNRDKSDFYYFIFPAISNSKNILLNQIFWDFCKNKHVIKQHCFIISIRTSLRILNRLILNIHINDRTGYFISINRVCGLWMHQKNCKRKTLDGVPCVWFWHSWITFLCNSNVLNLFFFPPCSHVYRFYSMQTNEWIIRSKPNYIEVLLL